MRACCVVDRISWCLPTVRSQEAAGACFLCDRQRQRVYAGTLRRRAVRVAGPFPGARCTLERWLLPADLHVIIFDEIDAICKARGSVRDGSGVHDTIVNQVGGCSRAAGKHCGHFCSRARVTERFAHSFKASVCAGRFPFVVSQLAAADRTAPLRCPTAAADQD